VFPVRYELNVYILFRRNPVFKGLIAYVAVWQTFSRVAPMTKRKLTAYMNGLSCPVFANCFQLQPDSV
jgi:hypothetical protein